MSGQEDDFANSLLLHDEYDMHVTRPKSSQVSRVTAAAAAAAAAAADDEFKSFVTAKAAAAAPDSPLMQKKLIEFAMLYEKLRKGDIMQLEFEEQIMDLELTEDQKQLASMLCLERLGGKKKSRYSKTNKMRRSKSNKRSKSRSNKRSKSRSNKRYRSRK